MLLMYKCPRCGGEVTLDEGAKELACAHCGNRISMFDSEQCETQLLEDSVIKELWFNETISFNCPTCGCNMSVGKEDITGKCAFCGNDILLEEQIEDEFAPDKIIAFRIHKDTAKGILEGYVRSRGLRNFECEADRLTGSYVPFWLYDFCGDAVIEGINRLDHDRFRVIRKGKITLEKVPLDASIKMSNDLIDAILPYNYSQLYDFQKGALAGFAAQKYDFRYDEMQDRLHQKIEEFTNSTLKDKMLEALHDPDAVRTRKYRGSGFSVSYDEVHLEKYESGTFLSDVYYALLPVWQYSFKYEGNIYHIYINGQTGKVAGNIPMTVAKAGSIFLKTSFDVFLILLVTFFTCIFGIFTAVKGFSVIVTCVFVMVLISAVVAGISIAGARRINRRLDYVQERQGYIMSDGFELYYGVEIPQ